MRVVKSFSIMLLLAVAVVACRSERGDVPLPEYEDLKISESGNRFSVDILYKRIKNCEKSDALSAIESTNYAVTFDEYAVEPADVLGSAQLLIDEYAAAAHEYAEYGGEYYYTLVQDVSFSRDNSVVCYESFVEILSGGAHGALSLMYDCYDMASGQMYDLSYLFDGEWAQALRTLIYDRLNLLDGVLLVIGSADEVPVTHSIMITDEGLLFAYQPSEVAHTTAGVLTVELTDADIAATGAPLVWVME